MSYYNLRQALENNDIPSILEIENKYRMSMKNKVGTDLDEIRRNSFSEENHITEDAIRDILLAGKDRSKFMVAVGR